MRIIIIGAGEVGFHIAHRLAFENKEVIVIDKRLEALKRFIDHLDVQTVQGSGSSPLVLQQAGIEGADILLAVTDSDETNLIACVFANALSPHTLKLARIRNEEYTHHPAAPAEQLLNISRIINPEEEVVKTIERLMSVPGAVDINEFADGRVKLIGARVHPGSPLAETRLTELPLKTGKVRVIITAIIRKDRLIIPTGKDRIQENDLVYFVCGEKDVARIFAIFGYRTEPMRNVMIIGGGNIGLRLATALEKKAVHTKIIEKSIDRCHFLVEKLQHTLVLQGDGTDPELLQEENIHEMDTVVSLTGDEETNILSSLLAKRLKAKRTITRIDKFAYLPIVGTIGLEHTVSPRLSAVNTILQHIRRGKVISAVSLKGEEAEALEAIALENSAIVGKPLKDLHFPKGAIVLAILRGDQIIIPDGDSVILPEDRTIIFSTRQNISRVEQALMVKLEYF